MQMQPWKKQQQHAKTYTEMNYKYHGIDVSHHQSPTRIVHSESPDFCVARATYGTRPDKEFETHIRQARAGGVAVTGYHFFRQGQTAKAQLNAFMAQLGRADISTGDIIPVLDLEANSKYDGPINPDLYGTGAQEMAKALRKSYGECIIYGGGWFYQLLRGHGDWILDYPMWVAHYRGGDTVLGPSTPPGKDWVMWQYEGRNNKYKPEAYPGGTALDVNVAKELLRIEPAPIRLAKALYRWITPQQQHAVAFVTPPPDYEIVSDSPRAG